MNRFQNIRLAIYLLSISILQHTLIYGQDPENTLKYHADFKSLIFKNPDSAFCYLQRLSNLKNKNQDFTSKYFYHQDSGQYFFVKHQLDSAEYHYKKAYEIGAQAKDLKRAIDSEIWIATLRQFKGEKEEAKLQWQKIFEKSEQINYIIGMANALNAIASLNPDLSYKINLCLKIDSLYRANNAISTVLANTYNLMGDIYLESNGNETQIEYYAKQGLEVATTLEYPHGIINSFGLLGESAYNKKEYQKAEQYFIKIFGIGRANKNPLTINKSLLRLAQINVRLGNLQKAEGLLRQSLANTQKNDQDGWAHLLQAEILIKQNRPKQALQYLEKGKSLIDLVSLEKYSIELNRVAYMYYAAIGDYKNALEAKLKQNELAKNLEDSRNKNAFILGEQKKEHAKREQEIALLKSKNELIEQQKISQRNFLLSGLLFVSAIGILLFFLYKNRLKTNNKLREIDALKTNFFTNISHEFRTPLTLISTPIQEILRNTTITSEQKSHFKIAQKNIKRLTSLVNQLLELSKIDGGNRKIQLEKDKATQFISAWVSSFEYLSKKKNISLKQYIDQKNLDVWFDANALEIITTNLLSNAIKYTPEGGTINIYAGIDADMLNLKVTNSGKGLTKDQLTKIFNRFYQSNLENEGSGIGLALVKELTVLHKGNIFALSTPHKETAFTATLCISKEKFKNPIIKTSQSVLIKKQNYSQEPAEKPQKTSKNNEEPIVLIIEDNTDLRQLLTDTFKNTCQVLTAKNGEQGIIIATEKIPDLIISDIMMPIKDGIELTKQLKEDERTSHIPILLLTAKSGDENELKGIEVGADDYITKPFNQEILKLKVANLITQRKKLQARYRQEVVLKPKDISISSVDEKFLEKIQTILDKKIIEASFNAEAFSAASNMSRMQLHRKLKALTGLTTTEFLRSHRLKMAAKLLKTSSVNISEIGYNVGFNNHAYFTKCFKETYKCTPTEYAKKA